MNLAKKNQLNSSLFENCMELIVRCNNKKVTIQHIGCLTKTKEIEIEELKANI